MQSSSVSSISSLTDLYTQSALDIKNQGTLSFEQVLDEIMNRKTSSTNESAKEKNKLELKKACQEMETYFLQLMWRNMRNTIKSDGILPKSNAENIFQDMLDEENSKKSAEAGGIGLADMLYKQLSRNL